MKSSLVSPCYRCGRPAHLRCAVCARTACRSCLDEDERLCRDCSKAAGKGAAPSAAGHPPSRRARVLAP